MGVVWCNVVSLNVLHDDRYYLRYRSYPLFTFDDMVNHFLQKISRHTFYLEILFWKLFKLFTLHELETMCDANIIIFIALGILINIPSYVILRNCAVCNFTKFATRTKRYNVIKIWHFTSSLWTSLSLSLSLSLMRLIKFKLLALNKHQNMMSVTESL